MRPKALMVRRSPATTSTASSLYHESLRGETCGGFLRLGKARRVPVISDWFISVGIAAALCSTKAYNTAYAKGDR